MRRTTLAIALLLSACAPQGHRDSVASASAEGAVEAPPLVPASSPSQIAGKWDVVSFENFTPQRLQGAVRTAYADFDARGVQLRIGCNYSGQAGALKEGRFVADTREPQIQTLMGCGPEREARDARYFAFFTTAPRVFRQGEDRLVLRSDTTELVLERPERRRLAFVPEIGAITGTWYLQSLTRYEPAGGYSGIGLSDASSTVEISADRLVYTACQKYPFAFRLTENGQLAANGSPPLPDRPDCAALDEPARGPELPVSMDALRVLHGSPWVERAGADQILLTSGELALLLSRSP